MDHTVWLHITELYDRNKKKKKKVENANHQHVREGHSQDLLDLFWK